MRPLPGVESVAADIDTRTATVHATGSFDSAKAIEAIETADGKFRGASVIDPKDVANVAASADAGHGGGGPPGGGHGGGPGGRGGPPGGRGGPPGGPGGFDPIQIFNDADANQDDKLAGDEIPDLMRRDLHRVDTDGNGEVSREEIEALAERFKGGGRPGGGRGGPGGGRGGPGGPGGGRGGDQGSDSGRAQRPGL